MMKKQLIALLFGSLIALPALAADLKVGVVNMQKLYSTAPQVESINKKIQTRFSGPKDALDKMAKTIQDLEKEIKRNELLMPEGKLKKSKENLMRQYQEFRAKEASLGRELKTVQQQELSVFNNVVVTVLGEVAKKGHYDLILNDGVMFAKPSLDITDDILNELKLVAAKK